MTDKTSEFQYEAAHLANKHLGESFDKNEKRTLGTEDGNSVLDIYEKAAESRTDVVTGLLNRRIWQDEMSMYYQVSLRNHGSFSIVMMDIDKLKYINDTNGHQSGDLVLQKFGSEIKKRFRESDICGRYGGDEAIVMLTTGSLKSKDIDKEEKVLMSCLSDKVGVGVSVGIENWDGHSSLEEMIKKVDERLYINKNKKNNNV